MRFTITNAQLGPPRNYSDRFGPKVAYAIEVEDAGGNRRSVEWSRQPTSPAPVLNQELEAEAILEPLPQAPQGALPKLSKVQLIGDDGQPMGQGGFSVGSQTSGGSSYGRSQTHPVDAARMGRSAAQKTAVEFVVGMANAGAAPGTQAYNQCLNEVQNLVSLFEGDVNDAEKIQRQDNGQEPAPVVAQTADDKVPF